MNCFCEYITTGKVSDGRWPVAWQLQRRTQGPLANQNNKSADISFETSMSQSRSEILLKDTLLARAQSVHVTLRRRRDAGVPEADAESRMRGCLPATGYRTRAPTARLALSAIFVHAASLNSYAYLQNTLQGRADRSSRSALPCGYSAFLHFVGCGVGEPVRVAAGARGRWRLGRCRPLRVYEVRRPAVILRHMISSDCASAAPLLCGSARASVPALPPQSRVSASKHVFRTRISHLITKNKYELKYWYFGRRADASLAGAVGASAAASAEPPVRPGSPAGPAQRGRVSVRHGARPARRAPHAPRAPHSPASPSVPARLLILFTLHQYKQNDEMSSTFAKLWKTQYQRRVQNSSQKRPTFSQDKP
ncbi:hypothetical protein EVAR_94930_1 [Eumeta japonica]|uniref:Uncharacterized protein n=1 Tax=Eumeta variegata TaxID=151549 RepID=A0A4C1Z634_EUMVA|nr:hypothetical protein EVAR_94930_1 [Eumeta japonica]